jgi:endonuclease IV
MKFGVKIYREKDTAEYFKDKADFLEVTTVPDVDYVFLRNYPLPIVIHAPHHKMGVNHADSGNREQNRKLFDYARSLADSVHSDKIVLHPGVLSNERCSKEEAISAIRALDKRILIENLPIGVVEGGILQEFLCMTAEEVEEFCKKTGKGFCLDINHAIDSAIIFGQEYISSLSDYLKLNPAYFHLGGQIIGSLPHIEHTSFDNSNVSLEKVLRMLPRNAEVALEVSTDIRKIEDDLRMVRTISAAAA